MNEIQQLKQQVAELTRRLNTLDSSQSLSLSTQKSFEQRGFMTFDNSIVAGYGTIGVSGESRIIIPNATINSVGIITPLDTPTSPMSAAVIASSSQVGQYELYVQGTATNQFAFIVFLTKYLVLPR